MSFADETRIELDYIESCVDEIVLMLKSIQDKIELAQGSLLVIGAQDSQNRDANLMTSLAEVMRRNSDIILNSAFTFRQLIWQYRPKL